MHVAGGFLEWSVNDGVCLRSSPPHSARVEAALSRQICPAMSPYMAPVAPAGVSPLGWRTTFAKGGGASVCEVFLPKTIFAMLTSALWPRAEVRVTLPVGVIGVQASSS